MLGLFNEFFIAERRKKKNEILLNLIKGSICGL